MRWIILDARSGSCFFRCFRMFFDLGLLMKSLFVANNLEGNHASCLVVIAFYNLAERPFTKSGHYLVAISNVVVHHNFVVTTIIVITSVGTFMLPNFLSGAR